LIEGETDEGFVAGSCRWEYEFFSLSQTGSRPHCAAFATKEQTVAEATGQTSRFLKVLEEYKKAPEVTRKRMYLETMERVLGGTDKIIIDGKVGQGVVPYLPLDSLSRRKDGGN